MSLLSSLLYCNGTVAVVTDERKLQIIYYDPKKGTLGRWIPKVSPKADWMVSKISNTSNKASDIIEFLVGASYSRYSKLSTCSISIGKSFPPRVYVKEVHRIPNSASGKNGLAAEFIEILRNHPSILRFQALSFPNETKDKVVAVCVRRSSHTYLVSMGKDVTKSFLKSWQMCHLWKFEKDSFWYVTVTYGLKTGNIYLYAINIIIDNYKPMIASIKKITTCEAQSMKEKHRIRTFTSLRNQSAFIKEDSFGFSKYTIETILANNTLICRLSSSIRDSLLNPSCKPNSFVNIAPDNFNKNILYFATQSTLKILLDNENKNDKFVQVLYLSPRANMVAISFSGYTGFVSLLDGKYYLDEKLSLDYKPSHCCWNDELSTYYYKAFTFDDKIKCVRDPFGLNSRKCIWLALIEEIYDKNLCSVIFNFVDEYQINGIKPWNITD